MTRKRKLPVEREPCVRMYTYERVTEAVHVTGALWAEIGRRLRELQKPLEACAAGGEAPVLMCRARVKLMLGAWRALRIDAQLLLLIPSGDEEHFRWMDEYTQVMRQWIATFESDLRDYGAPREGWAPEDGMSFLPEVAVALGRVVEVYDDWSLIAWPLSIIDAPCGHAESEVRKFDLDLKRVGVRIQGRRRAARQERKGVVA
jgi:hypothetical protein